MLYNYNNDNDNYGDLNNNYNNNNNNNNNTLLNFQPELYNVVCNASLWFRCP